MNYLLDTNILSELVKQNPNPKVISWLNEIPNESQYISVLTIGEIRKGVELAVSNKRKDVLLRWLEHDLAEWFEDRILTINFAIAERWGRLLSEINKPIPAVDSLIGATALHHDLCLVTRNEKDFKFPSLEVFNPF